MGETVIEKLMTLLVGILLALAGWTLTRTFDLSTTQAVQLDKVDKLERHVEKLQDKIELMTNKDEEIMEQHKKLFEALEDNQPTTGYNYN
jgi:phage terminase large subunit GpA-like protein